jgi:hypothetical protein
MMEHFKNARRHLSNFLEKQHVTLGEATRWKKVGESEKWKVERQQSRS